MKEISVIFFCAFKFALTFPVAVYGLSMSFWEVILYTNIGGFIGLLSSVYLSKLLLWLWDEYVSPLFRRNKKSRPHFTRRNRFIVKVKTRYGLPGIVILSPVLFSIPVGGFLMTKYYGAKIKNVSWLLSGQIAWSFVYTCFYMFVKDAVF